MLLSNKFLKYFILLFVVHFFSEAANKTPKITVVSNTVQGDRPYSLTFQIAHLDTATAHQLAQQFINFQKPTLMDEGKKKLESLTNFISANKVVVSAFGITSLYCYVIYKIININALISSKDSWCNWKQEIPFDTLLASAQVELSKELMTDIQKKYSDPKKLDNYMVALVSFYNDIHKELSELNKFIKLTSWIKFFKAEKIVQLNSDLILKAQEKINKLGYIKGLFGGVSADMKRSFIKSIYPY